MHPDGALSLPCWVSQRHQIWIQNYLGFIVLIRMGNPGRFLSSSWGRKLKGSENVWCCFSWYLTKELIRTTLVLLSYSYFKKSKNLPRQCIVYFLLLCCNWLQKKVADNSNFFWIAKGWLLLIHFFYKVCLMKNCNL